MTNKLKMLNIAKPLLQAWLDLEPIDDHINLMFRNPLIGANDDRLGERFPDMSEPYGRNISSQLHKAARLEQVKLKEGVYVGLAGPTYESRAEVEMLRRFGADAAGMSTVLEAITAKHAGLPVAAISECLSGSAVLFLKLSDAPRSIDDFLLPCIKWMTVRTNLYMEILSKS